jgi:quinol monooxygenase YgiN
MSACPNSWPIVSGSGQTAVAAARQSDPDRRRVLRAWHRREGFSMLAKVFPIPLKPGKQAEAERLVELFAPTGPGQEEGTLSFRVYRDPAKPDYLLFVEHFADQAAYDAHTGSAAYQKLIAGEFADLILEFVEIDHELIVGL